MDETPMNHVLEASDFTDAALRQLDDVAEQRSPRAPLPWRNYLRCTLLCCIILSVLYMAYRPSLLRFSIVMSLVSPSRGDSLAWKPEPDPETQTFAVRRTPSPAEWRLAARNATDWRVVRPDSQTDAHWQGGRLAATAWGRISANAWTWADDIQTSLKRKDDPLLTPAQRPATSFRTKDNAVWAAQAGIGLDVPALQSSLTPESADAGQAVLPGALQLPSFAPLNPLPGAVPVAETAIAPMQDSAPESAGLRPPTVPALPPISAPVPTVAETPAPAPIADSAAVSAAQPATAPEDARTEINVFQLPPLPPTMAADAGIAEQPAPNVAPAAALTIPEDETPLVSESIVLPEEETSPAPSLTTVAKQQGGTPLLPDFGGNTTETAAHSALDALVDVPTIADAPIAVPETPQQPDPFAAGSIIVSTPVATASEPSAVMTQEEPVAIPQTPVATVPAVDTGAASGSLRPSPVVSAPAETAAPAVEEKPDWKNREITAPIPGAYLTIYPKLKFVGLCVPGQGYIRKYNQVAVPVDLEQPKMHAADGRTPYGKYYVARHSRDSGGARIFLSWPSLDDARRIGLGPEIMSEVERAWQSQALPPQDSHAGGGVALSGDREQIDATSGGFALEEPHMEEIFTALPDGAWVFIQQQ